MSGRTGLRKPDRATLDRLIAALGKTWAGLAWDYSNPGQDLNAVARHDEINLFDALPDVNARNTIIWGEGMPGAHAPLTQAQMEAVRPEHVAEALRRWRDAREIVCPYAIARAAGAGAPEDVQRRTAEAA